MLDGGSIDECNGGRDFVLVDDCPDHFFTAVQITVNNDVATNAVQPQLCV
jgi:hypothetical protein